MKRIPLIALLLAFAACGRQEPQQITVAAAANLTEVFQEIGQAFEKQTGVHPVFSFGSTAQLARQVENGAPFDVIAAADSDHVDALDQKGLLLPGSRALYASGVLALWIPPGRNVPIGRLEDLLSPLVRVVAVAKPELAPYGKATVETLHAEGLWDRLQSKIVYAENIRMAKQYGVTGNADAVFTAYSLVVKEPGSVILIDDRLHGAITQELGIVASSQHRDAAMKFAAFVLGSDGRAAFEKNGYETPSRP